MAVPDGYVRNVCKIGQDAACCRYLIMDRGEWTCAKVIPADKAFIDDRVGRGQMHARGDNCPGWIDQQPEV